MEVVLLILYVAGVIAVPVMAERKHRNPLGWLLLSVLFLLPAFIAILLLSDKTPRKACPFCFSRIPVPATVCAKCGRDVEPVAQGVLTA